MSARKDRTLLYMAAFSLLLLPWATNLQSQTPSQTKETSAADFKSLSAQLSTSRLDGAVESQAQQEKALVFLDTLVLSQLNAAAKSDFDGANLKLASLVSHATPVGENYHLIKIANEPAIFALVVNFGLGGPAAVRIYTSAAGHYNLSASIDHFIAMDFFDSDIEVVPVSAAEPVFVIVAGRTDDLSTGLFSAWRFDGRRAVLLWTSDLLSQSVYEMTLNGFALTACVQPDEDHPARCLKKTRDLYRFQAGEWKRVESSDLALPEAPGK